MDYRINFENYKHNFSLPVLVVAEDLKDVHSDYLKIILMIFKNPDKEYSINLLSNLLNLSENMVRSGITYWIEKGVLLQSKTKAVPAVQMVSESKLPEKREINDAELKFLIDSMQHVLGRPVTSTDIRNITYIYEYYRMPADVILMAIQYSVDKGKSNMKYIESVCIGWYEQGVVTHALAEEYLKRAAQHKEGENQVKQIFGIAGRPLIASEEKYIETWLTVYQADFEMIALAYERTIKNTGKIAFAYTNKILSSWHQKGYHTIQDVLDNEPGSARTVKPGGSSFDIDLLDRMLDHVPSIHD